MARHANNHEVVDWTVNNSGDVTVAVHNHSWDPSLDGEDELQRFILRSVGVVVMIDAKGGRYLLIVQQADQKGNPWGIPAGIAKPYEAPESVAIRETYEETGLLVLEKDLRYLGTSQSRILGYGGIVFGYLGKTPPPTILTSTDSYGIRYFSTPNPMEVSQLCLVPEALAFSRHNPAFLKPYLSPRATLDVIGLAGNGNLLRGNWPRSDPGLDWPY